MSYMISDGDVHFARVQGNRAIKLLCVFIGDENKPVARVTGSPEARQGSLVPGQIAGPRAVRGPAMVAQPIAGEKCRQPLNRAGRR